MSDHTPTLETALLALRSHRQGVLFIAETATPVRFVIDGRTGGLVLPLSGSLIHAPGAEGEPCTLMAPEESDEALQLLVAVAELEPHREEARDRWQAYHGPPRVNRWAELTVESAKLGGEVFDGEPFVAPNPLRAAEAALCKRLNADRSALAEACRRAVGMAPAEPVAVGVDPYGFDVRARFGVLRVEFSGPAADAEAAAASIDRVLGKG